MAKKNAGQQYIASLKFRIDEAKKQMKELSKLTSDTSKSIGQELSNKIFTVKMDTSQISKMEKEYAKTQNKIVLENQKQANKIELIEKRKNANLILSDAEVQKTIIKEQTKTAEHAKRNANDIEKSYLMAGQNTKTVFQRIAENAKTYLTYNAFNEIKRAAEDLVEDLKKVETRMMEITRIMSDSSLVTEEYRDRIIELGYDYGRTFDETSEIVLNFARAGNSAEESIMLAEKALLALNTAELDAENATEGLISIMTQWGMNTGTAAEQAEKLELMIDKINKTADNFPLSSQDIIDALKRTSSAFDLAGASVDESIAMIVAAEAATKRGGKTIGTAINSMLQQIKTDTRLSAIEDLGIDVYTDETKQTYKSIVEIMGQMSEKMEQLKQDGKESSVEMQNLLSAFTVLRRNIGAGLLGNMTGEDSTYEQVLKTLDSAVGYSAQENANWMKTLESQLNQLEQTALKLKAAIWDSGLGDGLKDLIKIAEGGINVFTSMTKTFGALPTAVITANTAITMFSKNSKSLLSVFSGKDGGFSIDIGNFNKQMALLKKNSSLMEKDTKLLTTTFKNYINEVGEGSASLKSYTKYLVSTTAKTIALKAATALLQGAIIAIGSLAIKGLISAFDKLITTQEEYSTQLQKINDELKENEENMKSVNEKMAANEEKIKKIKETTGGLTSQQEKEIKNLENENKYLENQLKLYQLINNEKNKEKVAIAVSALSSKQNEGFLGFTSSYNFSEDAKARRRAFGDIANIKGENRTQYEYTVVEEAEENIKAIKELENTNKSLREKQALLNVETKKGKKQWEEYKEEVSKNDTAIETLKSRNLELSKTLDENYQSLKDVTEEEEEAYKLKLKIPDIIAQIVGKTEEQNAANEDLNKTLENNKEITDETQKTNEKKIVTIEQYIDYLSEMSNKYRILKEAQEEYNTYGNLQADTIKNIKDAGLLQYLDFVDGKIKINSESIADLINEYRALAAETLRTSAYQEILGIINQDLAGNLYDVQTPAEETAQEVKDVGNEAITTAAQMKMLNAEIAQWYGDDWYSQRSAAAQQAIDKTINDFKSKIEGLKDFSFDRYSSSSSGSRGKTVAEEVADRAKEALEKYKSIVDEFIRADERWTEMQKAYNNYTVNDELHVLRERARNYRKFAQEVMNETEIEYEERLKLQKEYIEAAEDLEVDYYELQKKEIEDLIGRLDDAYQERLEGQINAIESRADAELEAIDEVEEARDKQLAAEEYRERRRELLYGYEGVEYWSQRTGREAQLALAQAKKELEELDKEYQEQQREDSVENRKQAIENRRDLEIQALEAAKEHNYDMARSLGYDYIVQMGKAYETEKQNIIDNAQRRLNEYIAATDGAFVYAQDKSHDLFAEYKTGFIDPLDQAMQNVFDMTNLNGYTVTFEVDTMQQAAQQTMATTSEDYKMQMETLAANNKDLYNQIAAKYAGQYDTGVFKDMLKQELINPGTYIDRVATNGVTGLASTTGGTISSSISNSKSSSNSVNLSKGSSLVSINANVSNSVDVGSIAKKVVGAIASKLNIG